MHKNVWENSLWICKQEDGKDYDHIYDRTEKAAIDLYEIQQFRTLTHWVHQELGSLRKKLQEQPLKRNTGPAMCYP